MIREKLVYGCRKRLKIIGSKKKIFIEIPPFGWDDSSMILIQAPKIFFRLVRSNGDFRNTLFFYY